MSDSKAPTREMVVRIAAQLMVLYDDAKQNKNAKAARAFAQALTVLRNETKGVKIRFDGPPPTLRRIPPTPFPEELCKRLAPSFRPS